jgi:LSD1 subclass zinc finger protein
MNDMSMWHVGTAVCSGCGTVLTIKSISDSITCYLCDALIDLSEIPIVEIAGMKKSAEVVPEEESAQ